MVVDGGGQTKLVELLLDRGDQRDVFLFFYGNKKEKLSEILFFYIDCQGKQRLMALLYVARKNKEEIVHLLLDRGVNPNFEDSYGNTALEYAHQNKDDNLDTYIKKAHEKLVSYLLSQ